MRIFSNLTLLVICVVLGASGAWFYQHYTANDNAKFYPSVAQVKTISQLASLRLELSQIEQFEDKGWFVDTKASYYIYASVLLGADLDQLQINIDKTRKILTIKLPLPTVLSIEINHQHSHLITKQDYTFGVIPRLGVINTDPKDQVPDKAYLLAQQSMRQLASSTQYITQAQAQIAQILKDMYQPFNWRVDITWCRGNIC
ncbi:MULTISPECIES: DUF4230 domain-containing protein [Cysteiniphilum]|uniref:DUF4230 domain-containing protein n=1 Tax=Cysteiniphilum litorale TaxID=2056700 RepID=A0A8J3E6M0_9GAMM|nr:MULTISPECIES: DUF4230 domain-containing protein [Cysteiniphilum]GGF89643.1 hypothetical protein GCM10010995_03700 [Cysteiniphilum litorale]